MVSCLARYESQAYSPNLATEIVRILHDENTPVAMTQRKIGLVRSMYKFLPIWIVKLKHSYSFLSHTNEKTPNVIWFPL